MGKESYKLVFVAMDDASPPVAHRIRSLLKAAKRTFGLRCISVEGGEEQLRRYETPPEERSVSE